jgi:hypothetical protein
MAKAAELVVKAQVLPVDAVGVAADAGWNVERLIRVRLALECGCSVNNSRGVPRGFRQSNSILGCRPTTPQDYPE